MKTNRRLDTAKRLGAPFELCIQCLNEFLGPDGVEVRGDVLTVPDVMAIGTRTCCSLHCAMAYGDARASRIVIYGRQYGASALTHTMLAEKDGETWVLTDAGKKTQSEETR